MAGDLETYRSPDEIEAARAHEPLVVLRSKLLDRGSAEETLEQDRVPAGYEGHVRRYFQLIRPRD